MSLNIPEEDIQSLYTFSQLPKEIKEYSYGLLKNSKMGDTPKKISKNISDHFEVDIDDIFGGLNVYFVLVKTVHFSKSTNDEIISDLHNNIIDHDFDFDPEDLKTLEETVLAFINIGNDIPIITALAFDMIGSNANIYFRSMIYDELRPVFFEEKVSGLALFHTFRVHYSKEDKSHSDIYFAIDSEDIDDLIEQLNNAKKRINTIKEQYGNSIIQI